MVFRETTHLGNLNARHWVDIRSSDRYLKLAHIAFLRRSNLIRQIPTSEHTEDSSYNILNGLEFKRLSRHFCCILLYCPEVGPCGGKLTSGDRFLFSLLLYGHHVYSFCHLCFTTTGPEAAERLSLDRNLGNCEPGSSLLRDAGFRRCNSPVGFINFLTGKHPSSSLHCDFFPVTLTSSGYSNFRHPYLAQSQSLTLLSHRIWSSSYFWLILM